MKSIHLVCALAVAQLACSDETTSPEVDPVDAALPVSDSRPESFVWDSGGDGGRGSGGTMGDGGHNEGDDAGIKRCFREGAVFVEDYVGDPIDGLDGLRTDIDYNGDGTPEITLRRTDDSGVHFDFLDASEQSVLGTLTVPGVQSANLVPGLPAAGELVTRASMGGQSVFIAQGEDATGVSTLHVIDADTGAQSAQIDLGTAVQRLQLFQAGTTWHALVDRVDGTCAAYSLPAAMLAEGWESCRLEAGWDLNEDGLKDIVRMGQTGLAVLDGQILAQIAQDATTAPIAVGFGPDGPSNFRGQGPEIVSAAVIQGGDLMIRYHDPVELTPRTEGEAVPTRGDGVFVKARFINAADGTRLVGEYHRVNLKLLTLLEVADGLRRLGEYGSTTVLDWATEADADGDGEMDLRITAGARPDGIQTAVEFADLGNGMIVHTIAEQRSARYDEIWNTTYPPTASDLDGCPGIDHLTLRSSALRPDGKRATRLEVTNDGSVRFRGDTHDGLVHSAAMLEIDGVGPPEVLEIRSENDESARLRIFSVGTPPND